MISQIVKCDRCPAWQECGEALPEGDKPIREIRAVLGPNAGKTIHLCDPCERAERELLQQSAFGIKLQVGD